MHKRERTTTKKNAFTETGSALSVCVCVGESARERLYTQKNHIMAHWSRVVFGFLPITPAMFTSPQRSNEVKRAKTKQRDEAGGGKELKREHVYKMIVKEAVFAFHVYATNWNLFRRERLFSLHSSCLFVCLFTLAVLWFVRKHAKYRPSVLEFHGDEQKTKSLLWLKILIPSTLSVDFPSFHNTCRCQMHVEQFLFAFGRLKLRFQWKTWNEQSTTLSQHSATQF